MSSIKASDLYAELEFTASRSAGPGGQNVNKVNSRITLKFDIAHSNILSEEQKSLLLSKLDQHITKGGVLMLSSQEKRSQLENKQDVIAKLDALLKRAFVKRKPRKATKPSKASVEKRITSKKKQGEKKQWRKDIW